VYLVYPDRLKLSTQTSKPQTMKFKSVNKAQHTSCGDAWGGPSVAGRCVGPFLTCPKCQGRMRIISFIEDEEVVKKILKHLGLWLVKPKPPPRANSPPFGHHIDYADTQFPSYDDYNVDPEYPIDTYVL
jgi:hypothetical protein